MKNYQLNNQAANLMANVQVEEKTFMDLYNDVKSGKIVPVTDDQDNIVGFNVVKEKASMMKVCKMVNGAMTVGDTEDDRLADEIALRKFAEEYPDRYKVQRWFESAMLLIKANIVPDDIVEDRGDVYVVLADRRQIIDLNGGVVIDLSADEDIDKDTPKKIVIKLLKASFNSEF